MNRKEIQYYYLFAQFTTPHKYLCDKLIKLIWRQNGYRIIKYIRKKIIKNNN